MGIENNVPRGPLTPEEIAVAQEGRAYSQAMLTGSYGNSRSRQPQFHPQEDPAPAPVNQQSGQPSPLNPWNFADPYTQMMGGVNTWEPTYWTLGLAGVALVLGLGAIVAYSKRGNFNQPPADILRAIEEAQRKRTRRQRKNRHQRRSARTASSSWTSDDDDSRSSTSYASDSTSLAHRTPTATPQYILFPAEQPLYTPQGTPQYHSPHCPSAPHYF